MKWKSYGLGFRGHYHFHYHHCWYNHSLFLPVLWFPSLPSIIAIISVIIIMIKIMTNDNWSWLWLKLKLWLWWLSLFFLSSFFLFFFHYQYNYYYYHHCYYFHHYYSIRIHLNQYLYSSAIISEVANVTYYIKHWSHQRWPSGKGYKAENSVHGDPKSWNPEILKSESPKTSPRSLGQFCILHAFTFAFFPTFVPSYSV